jgi:dienelactone hydrolase
MNRFIALLLGLLSSAAMAQERPATLMRLPHPAGVAMLVTPETGGDHPLVVILPDALGADSRDELYVDSLLARGIASLRVGLGADPDKPDGLVEPGASPEAIAPAVNWALLAGYADHRIAVLGFGLGGRAALAGAAGLPAVALYPGCAGLAMAEGGPSLVLQGADEAGDCAALPAPPSMSLHLLAGAGHAWDAPGAVWPSPGPVLPNPAGGDRLRSRTDPETTRAAAELVAAWIERRLLLDQRRAAK